MHQFVSALIVFLISPVHWIILLVIIAYFLRNKRWKRILLITAAAVFIVFSNPLLQNWYAANWQLEKNEIAPLKKYSCGILLGGFASSDPKMNGYFNGVADRFIQALKMYKTGAIERIIISGGNSKGNGKFFGEASWAKGELISMAVPSNAVYTEDYSTNTKDNAIHSKRIIDSLHLPPPYLLITSADHMPRALLLFKQSGLEVEPFSSNYVSGVQKVSIWSFVPNLRTLLDWEKYGKELIGYTWYKLSG